MLELLGIIDHNIMLERTIMTRTISLRPEIKTMMEVVKLPEGVAMRQVVRLRRWKSCANAHYMSMPGSTVLGCHVDIRIVVANAQRDS